VHARHNEAKRVHVPNFSGISLRCAVLEESHPPTTRMKSTVLLSTMSVTASCLSFRGEGEEDGIGQWKKC
jgi:hypothetical protein